ncbi:MAG: ATP-binding protein [Actinomycetota bacterium]|nr:ATP-binding protein [Actinomycetota bacterium]
MRIAFVGKGGSGKTTLSALFIRHLAQLGRPVLAIDADINQHLGQALGLGDADVAAIPPLGADLAWIKDHLRGDNTRIASTSAMIKTTPPGRGSRLLRLDPGDELHRRFARPAGAAHLMCTGEFESDDIGVSCYHSKTGAVELYLNHLVDGPGEYVVVDMTAGADVLASGLFTRFDLVVLVSEPTRRGVGVHRQFREHAEGHAVRLAVLGNKVAGADDEAWLRAQLGDALLATVSHSAWVRAAEQGRAPEFALVEAGTRAALETVLAELDGLQRDWDAYHRDTVHFHLRNAAAWANRSVGVDLAEQVDPEFVPGPAALGPNSPANRGGPDRAGPVPVGAVPAG